MLTVPPFNAITPINLRFEAYFPKFGVSLFVSVALISW